MNDASAYRHFMRQTRVRKGEINSAELSDEFRTAALLALGEMIRERRKVDWNQEDFAYQCGVSRGYFGAIERGEHNVAVVNLYKIALALECEPSELLLSLSALKKIAKNT